VVANGYLARMPAPNPSPVPHAELGAQAEATARALAHRYNAVAVSRLAAFIALAIALAGAWAVPGPLPLLGVGAALAAFLLLALWHGSIDDRRQAALARIEYHRRGEDRVRGIWAHGQDDGTSFAPRDHPYAHDLDVVGPRGLFALLNSGASAAGRARLAALLLDDGLPLDTARPAAVLDLASRHAWRAELAAAAREAGVAGDDPLATWLAGPHRVPALAWRVLVQVLRVSAPLAVVAVGWWWGLPTGFLALLATAALLTPLNLLAVRFQGELGDADVARRALLGEAERLTVVARLAEATEPTVVLLGASAHGAHIAARTLAAALDRLAQRRNPLWSMIASPLLQAEWSNLARLQGWARMHAKERPAWRAALAEAEASACLATYVAEQGGCWPIWRVDGAPITASALAHPLLPRTRRIGNDLALASGQALLLTGANASGKSTFLRACGLAWVLARAGATVPAESCHLRPARLATVMRVGDDLAAGSSRFQAEVAALARAFARVDHAGDPLVVLLDEILAGTNSHERHLGTRAVLIALRVQVAALLITTHDLALCALADEDPGSLLLAHFADSAAADGNDLAFDYRLRPGATRSTNALRVMRAAGLPIPD